MKINKFIIKFWPAFFITIVWVIFSAPYFFKGLIPLPSKYLVTFFPPWNATYAMPVKNNAMPDVVTQIYPWKKLSIETWKKGEVPLWNPYSFSGTPHAANYQTAVFSPINLLFFIMPFVDAWSFAVLLQSFLAGIFMYIFLRFMHISKEASLLGSLAFMFCGFIVVWMAYGTLGYAALFLPLIFCGIFKQFEKSSWWNLVVVSLGLGFSFLSGHFQISLYVFLAAFAFVVYKLVLTKKWTKGFHLIIFMVLGLLLAAPQILPSFEAFGESLRSGLFQKGEIIPWSYLITFFVPDFFGNPVTRNDWFGHYAEWASYIGVIPLLISFWSLITKKTKDERFFWCMAIISLSLALPTVVSDLLYLWKVPVLSTSAASRIIILSSFSLSILSAFGFEKITFVWRDSKRDKLIFYCSGLILLMAMMWGGLFLFKPLEADKLSIAKHNTLLPTLIGIITISLIFAGKYLKKFRTAIIVFILCISAFDSLRFASKWMPFDPKEFVYPQLPVIKFLQKEIGANRVFGNFGNELATYFSVSSIEGYDAVYKKRYGEFIRAAANGSISDPERSIVRLDKSGKYTEKVLELLGTRFILHRLSDGRNVWAYPYWTYPWYVSVYKDGDYEVLENTKALPRAFLASSYVLAENDQKIISSLFDKNFDISNSIVLEQKSLIEPSVGEGSLTIKKYSPNNIVIETASQAPKLLFLSDVYDKGWKVKIDGQETSLYRANYTFRAIALPSGSHIVQFLYEPKSFDIGVAAASATLLFLLLGSLKNKYENRYL